jgi:uncharacterized protein YjbI with pentapeptide repeats
LRWVNLQNSNLTQASLANVDARGVWLTGAVLDEIDLYGTRLKGAIMPDGTRQR